MTEKYRHYLTDLYITVRQTQLVSKLSIGVGYLKLQGRNIGHLDIDQSVLVI